MSKNIAKIGDKVRFLNYVGGGVVSKIEGKIAYVTDADGFDTPVLLAELVVTGDGDNRALASVDATITEPAPIAVPSPAPEQKPEPAIEPYVETASGERLNIVLGYEPTDLKHLSESVFDIYIVNDSNYYLSVAYMVRENGMQSWTAKCIDTIEPGICQNIGRLSREELSTTGSIALQYIAYKKDKAFSPKQPAWVEHKFDATKFFKLHCFRDSEYFATPAITFDIVRNDRPVKEMVIDEKQLQQAIATKKNVDIPHHQPVKKTTKRPETIVVDLHAHELLDNLNGLSASDILNVQIDRFSTEMDKNLRHHGQKIVFIHGKGNGTLRQALLKELNHRYKGHDVQDASFREYGFGATQVTIH